MADDRPREICRRATFFQYKPFDDEAFKTDFEKYETPWLAAKCDKLGAAAGGFAGPEDLPKSYMGAFISIGVGLSIMCFNR